MKSIFDSQKSYRWADVYSQDDFSHSMMKSKDKLNLSTNKFVKSPPPLITKNGDTNVNKTIVSTTSQSHSKKDESKLENVHVNSLNLNQDPLVSNTKMSKFPHGFVSVMNLMPSNNDTSVQSTNTNFSCMFSSANSDSDSSSDVEYNILTKKTDRSTVQITKQSSVVHESNDGHEVTNLALLSSKNALDMKYSAMDVLTHRFANIQNDNTDNSLSQFSNSISLSCRDFKSNDIPKSKYKKNMRNFISDTSKQNNRTFGIGDNDSLRKDQSDILIINKLHHDKDDDIHSNCRESKPQDIPSNQCKWKSLPQLTNHLSFNSTISTTLENKNNPPLKKGNYSKKEILIDQNSTLLLKNESQTTNKKKVIANIKKLDNYLSRSNNSKYNLKKDLKNKDTIMFMEKKDKSFYMSNRQVLQNESLPIKLSVLLYRERQIAIEKANPIYIRYMTQIPKDARNTSHPSTPRADAPISCGQFYSILHDWRQKVRDFV